MYWFISLKLKYFSMFHSSPTHFFTVKVFPFHRKHCPENFLLKKNYLLHNSMLSLVLVVPSPTLKFLQTGMPLKKSTSLKKTTNLRFFSSSACSCFFVSLYFSKSLLSTSFPDSLGFNKIGIKFPMEKIKAKTYTKHTLKH